MSEAELHNANLVLLSEELCLYNLCIFAGSIAIYYQYYSF
jgi:hypothetical protein